MSRSVIGYSDLSSDPRLLLTRLYDIFRTIDRTFVKRSYRGEVTWNPASIADGSKASTTLTVVDARVTDAVTVFPPYDLQELTYSGNVTADNTVEIVLANNTGSAVDLGSGTWRVQLEKW